MEPSPNQLIEEWLQGTKSPGTAKAAAAPVIGDLPEEPDSLVATHQKKNANAARERLFSEHFVPIVSSRVSLRFSRSSPEFEDVSQEALLRLTHKLNQLRERGDSNGAL